MEIENKYLSLKDLEKIKNHSYKTTGYSKLDNIMNPFWIWCSDLLPTWLSPNYVTLLGLLSQFLGVMCICLFDFSLKKEIPNMMYALFAFFVFLGQTFDAIDGKHARKTNKSSPLGQLMDHGCDAFSNSFVSIMISQTFLFGSSIYTIILQSIVQFAFFAAQWEENQTKIIKTHINNVGVTEFQFLTMGLLICPLVFGHSLADKGLLGGSISFAEAFCLLNAISGTMTALNVIYENVKGLNLEEIFSRIYPFYSFLILFVTEYMCLKLKIFENCAILVVLLNGFYFGFQTSKLILCTMSDKKIELICYENIFYFLCVLIGIVSGSVLIEVLMMIASFAFLTLRYSEFISLVTYSLLKFLNIGF